MTVARACADRTLISAGNAPDLANIATLWLPEMVSLDVVEALDSYVKPEFREKFIPISLRGAEYQGKLYGLPIAVSARALYCNAGLLDAAGQKPSTSQTTAITAVLQLR